MRTPEHGWRHAATEKSHRLVAPIIALTLLTVGTLIYLVPTGGHDTAAGAAGVATRTVTGAPLAGTVDLPSASASIPEGTRTVTTSASATSSAAPTPQDIDVVNRTTVVEQHPTSTVTAPGATTTTTKTRTTTAPDKAKHCWDFTWQQDAQAAYLANLSDPWGLDGDPGPANGDGLACTQLPTDPSRPDSTPADPYVPPAATAATKAALVDPSVDYYGMTQDGLPGSTSALNTLDTEIGKAPSSIGFFAYWDSDYPAGKITAAWDRGALPVMTWLSKPSNAAADSTYSMTNIINGNWDNYLYAYAGAIVRTGLPVVIRFDHEMNGNWYPWSAGETAWNNSPAKYVAMWRHVWNIFQQVGANDDVIWLWSPARVDNVEGYKGTSTVAADYPGDAYVDWVGATVYWRTSTEATDYKTSFGRTIGEIRAVTSKPLFFAEIGALQSYHNTDVTAQKQQWMQNTLQGFLDDPSVVGFDWFNNIAETADDPGYPHDWRVNSSTAALSTFASQVTDPRFAGGTMPDPTDSTGS